MKPITTTLRLAAWTLGGLCLAGAAMAMDTEDALKTLLGDAAPAPAPKPELATPAPASSMPPALNQAMATGAWPLASKDTGRIVATSPSTSGRDDAQRTVMVVPGGATLAALLTKTSRESGIPLKQLYQPFVALNPQAFVRGNPNRLMAGAKVRMLNAADLAALSSGRPAEPQPGSPEDRRTWVRFP